MARPSVSLSTSDLKVNTEYRDSTPSYRRRPVVSRTHGDREYSMDLYEDRRTNFNFFRSLLYVITLGPAGLYRKMNPLPQLFQVCGNHM